MSTQISELESRRSRSVAMGCVSCAAVFVVPGLVISSGSWGMIAFLPLFVLIFSVLAIVGWVSAGNRKAEIIRLAQPDGVAKAKVQPVAESQTLEGRIAKAKRAGL